MLGATCSSRIKGLACRAHKKTPLNFGQGRNEQFSHDGYALTYLVDLPDPVALIRPMFLRL